jgi:phage shock protein A
MFRLFRRSWRYLVALLGRRFEDAADPEIQIEQAIEEGKRQHALLVQQAAAVIGNQREVELRLGRAMDQVEDLRASARESLRLADEARGEDDATAANYEQAAQSFAVALVSTESEMKDLKVLHDHAVTGAAAAKEAVETNALELRRRFTERTRLLSQLEQAKLQERMNDAIGSVSALAPQGDVPSFERIRDKIDRRYARALGTAELSSTTVEVMTLQVQKASLDAEAALRLASLRASLREGA